METARKAIANIIKSKVGIEAKLNIVHKIHGEGTSSDNIPSSQTLILISNDISQIA